MTRTPQPPSTPTASHEVDPWFTERGAMRHGVEWPAPWVAGVGLALALLLLGGFYLVLNQHVARAQAHWASITPATASAPVLQTALATPPR